MNPLPFQLALTTIVAGLLVSLFRRRSLRLGSRLFWFGLWMTGLVLVWFPDLSSQVAVRLGITRGVDVVTFCGVAILSGLVFRLHAALERQEEIVTRLVSELALRDLPED